MRRPLLLIAAVTVMAATAMVAPLEGAAAGPSVSVASPASAQRGLATAITITLPADVAAVDGRVLFAGSSVDVIGLAPVGGGTAMRPVPFKGGASFGAYDLHPTGGKVRLQLVVVPQATGRLNVRVVIDSAATRAGRRLDLGGDAGGDAVTGFRVGRSARVSAVPGAVSRLEPTKAATAPQELVADGKFTARDLDAARLEWTDARDRRAVCRSTGGDANGDGCTDIVDVQATLAQLGERTDATRPDRLRVGRGHARTLDGTRTFTVKSNADTPDALPGDGLCADALGRCTLRAAISEADYLPGDDRIAFALDGAAPVTIQLTGRLPIISSRVGTLEIDGYTQPGSGVNTAEYGFNGVPGVELVGNGNDAREAALRITSGGNTIRGLAIRDVWRAIMLDGDGATGNRVIGNWVGLTRAGGPPNTTARYGILLNVGAHGNFIGSPAPEDRNLVGYTISCIDVYGPATDGNAIRGNLLAVQPNGARAPCHTGVDFNFGPKANVVGGDDPRERNVIGPTQLQGVELSHGWDPTLPWGTDTATTYQISTNKIIGNWVGFKADGSYDAAYRSGFAFSNADNGNGINVHDGVYDNVVSGNYVASVYDGIHIQAPNALRNILQHNTIGESPKGEMAPLTGWGVIIRWNTKHDVVVDNLIRAAQKGGVGLVRTSNTGTQIAPAYNIRISHNIVKDTPGLGIDLFGSAGPEPNDAGDADAGANTLLNTPVITVARPDVIKGTASPRATVEVYRASRPAGQNGLPDEFLGETVVATDGTWELSVIDLTAGESVTALQVRPDDTTSELGTNVAVSSAPTVDTVVGNDEFERTVSAGWGSANVGGPWKLTGTGFSVGGGLGRVAVPAAESREARLGVGARDVVVTGKTAINRLPVGGSVWTHILARANATSAYRAAIRISPTGGIFVQLKKVLDRVESNISPEVNTGLVAKANGMIRFRFQVVGKVLKFRVWAGGTTEPGVWTVSATDGSIGAEAATGMRTIVGKPVSNGPVTFSLDSFTARLGS
jgi:hypothetical protein